MSNQLKTEQRLSGIELLKIIAMFIIVISHTMVSLSSINEHFHPGYVINISGSTNDVWRLVLNWYSTFGAYGNMIFFACSAWFLIDNNKTKINKVIRMMIDIWIINVITMLLTIFVADISITKIEMVKVMLPTFFHLNWYLTVYIWFYLIHSGLNTIITSLSKEKLLKTTLLLVLVVFGFNNLYGSYFGSSIVNNLIYFITIYFAVGYLKIHAPEYCKNKKINLIVCTLSILIIPALIIISNYLGLKYSFFSSMVTKWGDNSNLFIAITSISLINIFNQIKFNNKNVNLVSSTSMLVYVIHENYLFRTYFRPYIWMYVYENFGYNYIQLKVVVVSAVIFICSLMAALIYEKIFRKIISKISDILAYLFNAILNGIISKFIEIN